MNPDRFDDLTKALATSPSRRRALKTIAAATLGSILGLGGIGTAFAKCKGGHRCTMDKTCCSKHCCNGVCCPAGQQCCGDFGCAVVCPTPT